MKGILVYQSPDKEAQLPDFIESLEPRLREKIIMRLYQLSRPQKPEMKEPHFKRFSLERYPSTSYADLYGSYNYGGVNAVDYLLPELPYGSFSTTQTGVMEKGRLPGLQHFVNVSTGTSGYGVDAGGYGTPIISGGTTVTPIYREPAYTSAEDMERKDGSIGTLKIPVLGINMKVWEGETNASMAKGLGHYSRKSVFMER